MKGRGGEIRAELILGEIWVEKIGASLDQRWRRKHQLRGAEISWEIIGSCG
jgi:hypothetical protein